MASSGLKPADLDLRVNPGSAEQVLIFISHNSYIILSS